MTGTIVFDMGGVLLDLDRVRCVEAFMRLGFGAAQQMLDPYRQTGILGELESGRVGPAEFYDHVRRESGRAVSDEQVAAALNAFVVGLPEYKLLMLSELKKKYRLLLLSNTNAVMMPDIKARYFTQLPGLTFDDYFEQVFLSYEMGCIKPAPEIFLSMIDEAELTPSECLFIDDGPANIQTAAALGFQTYQPRPREDFRQIFA